MSTLEFNDALLGLEQYLRAFAMTYTRNEEEARDLTQETLLKALTYRHYYQPKTNFKAWVFTIMRNTFINNYRRNSKTGRLFQQEPENWNKIYAGSSQENPENHMLGLEIQKQLNLLQPEFRIPFQMHHEGYKYQEIADALKIPVGTVKSRIFIARKRLSEPLQTEA